MDGSPELDDFIANWMEEVESFDEMIDRFGDNKSASKLHGNILSFALSS